MRLEGRLGLRRGGEGERDLGVTFFTIYWIISTQARKNEVRKETGTASVSTGRQKLKVDINPVARNQVEGSHAYALATTVCLR